MVSDRYVTVNDARLHYRDWGDPQAQPLLLIHGYPGHAHTWDTFAEAVSDQRRVIAVDLRGHGESDWSDAYSFASWADDINRLADAIALPRFTLLGHSLGSTIGFCFAAAHGQRIDRLIALDGLPLGTWEPTTPNAGSLPNNFGSYDEAAAYFRQFAVDSSDEALRAAVAHNLKPTATGGWTWRHDLAVRDAILRELRYDDGWRDRAAGTDVSITYLRCGRTHVGGYEETASILRVFPDCQLVDIPDAVHAMPTRAPELLASTVRGLL